jgi:hypothetical protein
VLGVLGLALLPPEHVHVPGHDDHVSAEVVHRHFEPHRLTRPETHAENPDADATYFANVFTLPADPVLAGPPAVWIAVAWPSPASPESTPWPRRACDLRVHDPPWARALALRGPPSLVA